MPSPKRPKTVGSAPPERKKTPTLVPPDGSEYRARMRTVTDEDSLEAARIASQRTSAPPAAHGAGPLALAYRLGVGGDAPAATAILDQFLRTRPKDRTARTLAEDYRVALRSAKPDGLPSLAFVPALAVTREMVSSLPIDERSGFLVGFIDGVGTIEAVAGMSGFAVVDVLGAVAHLFERGYVTFMTR